MEELLHQDQLLILGRVIPPLMGNPYNRYINPYYKVNDHPYYRKTMEVRPHHGEIQVMEEILHQVECIKTL